MVIAITIKLKVEIITMSQVELLLVDITIKVIPIIIFKVVSKKYRFLFGIKFRLFLCLEY